MNKIILIGFPLTGKTLIGQILASNLNIPFFDADNILNAKNYLILRDKNINLFREKESELYQNIDTLLPESFVFATGGGVVLNHNNFNKMNGIIIFLKLSKDILCERNYIYNHHIYKKSVDKVYHERISLYEKYADIIFDISDKSINEIIGGINEKIKNFNN